MFQLSYCDTWHLLHTVKTKLWPENMLTTVAFAVDVAVAQICTKQEGHTSSGTLQQACYIPIVHKRCKTKGYQQGKDRVKKKCDLGSSIVMNVFVQ